MNLNLVWIICLNSLLITTRAASVGEDVSCKDEPLYLTPYIESGNLEQGRKLAQVKPFLPNVESYSGLLTVDKRHNSNMFFWYFPSQRRASEVPLLLWINGYSTASTYGVFLQTGPYDFQTEKLQAREESWQKYYHVVYIDSPVGVGFSFTNSSEGYSNDLDMVSLNLQIALEQFLQLFPQLSGQELYLTGLSLGGKYIPSLARRIYKMNSFNLKGIFLGNPLLDIDKQTNFASYLYELGFIDRNQQPDLILQEKEFKSLLRSNDFEAFKKFSDRFWLDADSYLINITGLNNVFDYDDVVIDTKYYTEFLQRDSVKRALHVSGIKYDDGSYAMSRFGRGIAFSTLGYLGEMAEDVKMMFYAGQTDVSCAYPMMVDALMSVKWSGQKEYSSTPRQRLYKEDGTNIWGYMRNYKTITDVMVRKAGHSAVTSQPRYVLQLLHNFTDYKRYQ